MESNQILAEVPVIHVNISREPAKLTVTEPNDVIALLRAFIPQDDKEHFVRVDFDNSGRVSGLEHVAQGLMDEVPSGARETFRGAILNGAASVLVAHNHPSGLAFPSQADRGVTERLGLAGKIIGIPLVDHIVIGEADAWSIRFNRKVTPGDKETAYLRGGPNNVKETAQYENSPGHAELQEISAKLDGTEVKLTEKQKKALGARRFAAMMADMAGSIDGETSEAWEARASALPASSRRATGAMYGRMEAERKSADGRAKSFDLTSEIMAYEDGTLSEDRALALFQYLVDTGMAWTLQGSYGRTAQALIDQGLIRPAKRGDA